MSRRSTKLLKAALSALYYTGADGLLSPLTRGAGAILMLHQVQPGLPDPFEPNRILRVTPEFLDQTIRQVIEAGFEIISLDEVATRLKEGSTRRPFVAFTLDDGYRDNLVHAYPVFKRYGVPFTVYVPTDYADGSGELWWLALEHAIRAADSLTVRMDGLDRAFALRTPELKDSAFHTIYWWLRRIDEGDARAVVRDICTQAGFDHIKLCRDLIMTWDELRAFAADPLVTIGAHTKRHYSLAKLPEAEAQCEMAESIARLERELGRPCRHFSYPFGDESAAGPREFALARELGVTTAVTTRKGLVHNRDADSLQALPRVSLNGDYQEAHYVKVLLSGAPFLFWDLVGRMYARNATAPCGGAFSVSSPGRAP
jgi:peptidoglycan/xylan/chitin deacetylase (PgdA/CDA1 family)